MKVKIFDIEEEGTLLEEKINDLLLQGDVVSVEVVIKDNLLIIFYKSFIPKC